MNSTAAIEIPDITGAVNPEKKIENNIEIFSRNSRILSFF